MNFNHYHYFSGGQQILDAIASLRQAILQSGVTNMSKLSDKLDVFEKSVEGAVTRTQNLVSGLRDDIAKLQAKADAGDATDAELARIDALQAKLDALDPTVPAVLPDVPPADQPAQG